METFNERFNLMINKWYVKAIVLIARHNHTSKSEAVRQLIRNEYQRLSLLKEKDHESK